MVEYLLRVKKVEGSNLLEAQNIFFWDFLTDGLRGCKWLWRSLLTSNLNSVTSIIYVAMLLWLVKASSDSISPEGGLSSIDLRGFAAGKN